MEAKEIKSIRRKLGLTQKELAAKLKVDAITVSRWERGEQRPKIQAQRRLERLKVNYEAKVAREAKNKGTSSSY